MSHNTTFAHLIGSFSAPHFTFFKSFLYPIQLLIGTGLSITKCNCLANFLKFQSLLAQHCWVAHCVCYLKILQEVQYCGDWKVFCCMASDWRLEQIETIDNCDWQQRARATSWTSFRESASLGCLPCATYQQQLVASRSKLWTSSLLLVIHCVH